MMRKKKSHEHTPVPRRFKPYPAYKDSGIEWLGEIPAHWEVKRLWHLTPADRRIMYGIVLPGPNVEEGVPIVKGGDVSPERLRLDRLNRTTFEIESGYVRSRLRGGDLVFAIRGSIGEVAIVPDELEGANLTQDAARIAYTPAIHGTWLLHVLKSAGIFAQLEAGALGATIRGINIRDLKRASIPVPPRGEQELIARFLERQRARIDALVEKKEHLIELLQEKRTALISRVVTKGLNPNVPMRDSGVEWLGKIPAHWEVKRVKRLCLVRRGASPRPIDDPSYFDEEGEYAWVRITDVTASERYLERTTQSLSALGKSKSVALEPGDLFLSIAATVGKPIVTKIKCCIHDGFVYFVGLHENREFLYYLFSCGEPYKGLGKQGTQLNLNTDTIGDIYLPLPSSSEQEMIVQFLDFETARIGALVAKVRDAIDRLKELRSALISAAVTGKIDVREEVA